MIRYLNVAISRVLLGALAYVTTICTVGEWRALFVAMFVVVARRTNAIAENAIAPALRAFHATL